MQQEEELKVRSESPNKQLINDIEEILGDAKTERNEELEMAALNHNEETKNTTAKSNSIMPRDAGVKIVGEKQYQFGHGNPDAETAMEDANQQLTAQKAKILAAHEANNLSKNKIESAKQLMQKVMYQVPLSRLYSIMASCQFDQSSNFCPILVKINDETIRQNNGGLSFLLQVWTIKGEMIFEKPLVKPVSNWNISDNILLFLEEINSTEVWVVKLYENQAPTLFKFIIPSLSRDKAINSVYDHMTQNYIIPKEDKLGQQPEQQTPNAEFEDSMRGGDDNNDLKGLVDEQSNMKLGDRRMRRRRESVRFDMERMRSLGEINENFKDNYDDAEKKSISQMFKNRIIQRAPDKMIDYLSGYILLSFRNHIVYLDVHKHVEAGYNSQSSSKVIEVKLEDDKYAFVDMDKSYKIVAMQHMGVGDMTSLVLEHLQTRQIRFLRVDPPTECSDENVAGTSSAQKDLNFVQLGVLNLTYLQESPLLKYRTVAKVDEATGDRYQVSVVIRENGAFEVYQDFSLVNEFFNPELQCVDVETDFDQFYFKFVSNVNEIAEYSTIEDLKIEIRAVRHIWRNRISFSTMRLLNQISKWNWVLHRRISRFCRLYTSILNFNMYMLVSHRNMISIYDMTQSSETAETKSEQQYSNGGWIKTITFTKNETESNGIDWQQQLENQNKEHIRQMWIKKRNKEDRLSKEEKKRSKIKTDSKQESWAMSSYQKYQIVCITGTNTINVLQLSRDGKVNIRSCVTKLPGRILSFQDDPSMNLGVLLLVQNQDQQMEEFVDVEGCRLFKFAFGASGDATVTLYALKMLKYHPLLSSTDNKCVAADSIFNVMEANRDYFLKQVDNSRGFNENDPMRIAFKDKQNCSVLVCQSATTKVGCIFPVIKEREQDSKLIKQISLITKQDNCKKLAVPQEGGESQEDGGQLLSSFFMLKTNSYSQITSKQVSLYDKDMQIQYVIRGLNIRGCMQLDQRYLYAITDSVNVPVTIKSLGSEEKGEEELDMVNPSGFYVYNTDQLLQGRVQKYKLASTVGGQCSMLDSSKFGDRVSLIQSYDHIIMIPFPHLNLLNCVGMGHKSEYLIWREKNGFFTALDKRSNLLTWSMITGKMLYREDQRGHAHSNYINKYEVYRGDGKDITYTRNFYQGKTSSISLLKSKEPAESQLFHSQKELKINHVDMQRIQQENQEKNNAGKQDVEAGTVELNHDLFQTESSSIRLNLIKSQQRSSVYHFKVMQLASHEDRNPKNAPEGEIGSDCSLRFHFFFELLSHQPDERLLKFEWDLNSKPYQRLYLSQNTHRMLEVINNKYAKVYERENIDAQGQSIDMEGNFADPQSFYEPDSGQQVRWKTLFRIQRYPTGLAKQTSVPYLFSPNFIYQFDFNYRQRQVHIKETETQFVYFNFPKDLIDTLWNGQSGHTAVTLISSRFKWITEKTFKIVNKSNLDCLFEICSKDPLDRTLEARYLKLISVAKVDNLHQNTEKLDAAHLIDEPQTLDAADVLNRLARVSQDYKVSLIHALNTKHKGISEKKTRIFDFDLRQKINKIDYEQPMVDYQAGFDIEMSYTWLDWRIMNLLGLGDIDIKDVDEQQKIQICFNILPGGTSFLHQLAEADVTSQKDQIKAFYTTKDLFEVTSNYKKNDLLGADDSSPYEIPILPNIYGDTCIDLCLGLSKGHTGVYEKNTRSKDSLKKIINLAMADAIFDGIKDYGFMHSSSFIIEAVTKATKMSLPSIFQYLENRSKPVQHCFFSKTEHGLNGKFVKSSPSMGDYALLKTEIWVPESDIRKKIFDSSQPLQPMEMNYLDIPIIYRPTQQGFDFVYALTKSKDLNLFSSKSVQIVIDSQMRYWYRINHIFYGLPMVINLIVFWYWSNVVLINLGTDFEFQASDERSRLVLNTTGIYLLSLEISAVIRRRLNYFTDMARLFNIITPSLILYNVWTPSEVGLTTTTFWTVQTWAALAIWFRFLLYMRTVNMFNWLVTLIVASVVDMVTFIVVLMIGIMAFADAFLSIESVLVVQEKITITPMDSDADFYELYFSRFVAAWQRSFMTALGDFDSNLELYREGDWLVFLICCFFNVIVMLNLLIAIISETFAIINAEQVNNTYQEKARQVSMIQDTLLGYFKYKPDPNEMMFVAKVISSVDIVETNDDQMEIISQNVEQIKSSIAQLLKSNDQADSAKSQNGPMQLQ